MSNPRVILFTTTAFLAITLIFYSYKMSVKTNSNEFSFIQSLTKEQRSKVKIRDIEIAIDIAETGEEKTKGLSGRTSLGENEGMLFIFEKNSVPSFWMKDMLIPIDIIWISEDTIIDIYKNIPAPDIETSYTNLPFFTPKKPINHVLEVNAGFTDKHGIDIGDMVEIRI